MEVHAHQLPATQQWLSYAGSISLPWHLHHDLALLVLQKPDLEAANYEWAAAVTN